MNKLIYILPLILMNGCALINTFLPRPAKTPRPSVSQSKPTAIPNAISTESPIPSEDLSARGFMVSYQQEKLESAQPQIVQTHDGNLFTAGQYQLIRKGVLARILMISKHTPTGTPLWSKGFEMDNHLQMGDLVFHDNALYLSATVIDKEVGGVVADPNLDLRDIVLARLNLDGTVVWKQRLNLPRYKQPFRNNADLIPVGSNQIALNHFNRVWFFDSQGKFTQGIEFPGPIKHIHKSVQGTYLVNHSKIDPGNTLVSQGFQLTALNSDFSVKWHKYFAANLKGQFALSDIHPITPNRYHLAFSINDLSNVNSIGIVHLFFDINGEPLDVFADLTENSRGRMGFTQIHSSQVSTDAIYINATHSGGRNGSLVLATSQYTLDGKFLAFRSTDPGVISVRDNQLLSASQMKRFDSKLAFQIKADDFSRARCQVPDARIRRDENISLTVDQSGREAMNISLPITSEAKMTELPLEIRQQNTACS